MARRRAKAKGPALYIAPPVANNGSAKSKQAPKDRTAPSTLGQLRSNAVSVEAGLHPWVAMCLDPESAPPALMPDQFPHPVFPYKTSYTTDLTLDANGRCLFRVPPLEATVMYTNALTGTVAGTSVGVTNPDATDLETMSYKARLCCGAVYVVYTGRDDEGAGKIMAAKWAGDESTSSVDASTVDFAYSGRLVDGLYAAMYPVDVVPFATTNGGNWSNSHHSLVVYITGGPVGVKASLTVVWNYELMPKNTTGFRGLGRVEPMDLTAMQLACNCMNREIVSYTKKPQWKARAKALLQAAVKQLLSSLGGAGWAAARSALASLL